MPSTLPVLSGLESAAQLHLAEVHAEGLLEERDIVAAMETAQTQRPVQQRSQQQGLTTISLEEQKILLSLDRLNRQLFCKHCVKADCIRTARTDRLDRCDLHTTEVLICFHFNTDLPLLPLTVCRCAGTCRG